MNERIKELVQQATSYKQIDGENGWFIDGENGWFPLEVFDKEKFAELIVKECMDIARTVRNISEPDDFALDRCYEIEQRIQDRFGVEE